MRARVGERSRAQEKSQLQNASKAAFSKRKTGTKPNFARGKSLSTPPRMFAAIFRQILKAWRGRPHDDTAARRKTFRARVPEGERERDDAAVANTPLGSANGTTVKIARPCQKQIATRTHRELRLRPLQPHSRTLLR